LFWAGLHHKNNEFRVKDETLFEFIAEIMAAFIAAAVRGVKCVFGYYFARKPFFGDKISL
jgi:hypothetical protein